MQEEILSGEGMSVSCVVQNWGIALISGKNAGNAAAQLVPV